MSLTSAFASVFSATTLLSSFRVSLRLRELGLRRRLLRFSFLSCCSLFAVVAAGVSSATRSVRSFCGLPRELLLRRRWLLRRRVSPSLLRR